MLAYAFVKQNIASTALIFIVAAVLSLAVAIRVSGIRPYGEQAILKQIDHEDSTLCRMFGLAIGTSQFSDCMIALADLRRHHVGLLSSYSWM